MKKTFIKVLTLTLVAIMLVCSLASCGKKVESGSYEAEIEVFGQSWNVTYTFKGSKVEAVNKITLLGNITTETAEGKYEIVENDDGIMEITFEFEEENDSFENKTVTYKEGDGYIELGGVKYNKVEK